MSIGHDLFPLLDKKRGQVLNLFVSIMGHKVSHACFKETRFKFALFQSSKVQLYTLAPFKVEPFTLPSRRSLYLCLKVESLMLIKTYAKVLRHSPEKVHRVSEKRTQRAC